MSQPLATPDRKELLRSAFVRIEQLEARLRDKSAEGREPIAIIGLACRFPAGANDPERFWQLLRDGVDAISDVPRSRWDIDAVYDPNPDVPGKIYARGGGFLDRVDGFDPQFFGIAPREAANMDPQQRLLLEVTWEALEHAAVPPLSLTGSATGVFIGLTTADYSRLLERQAPEAIDAYFGTGVAASVAAGRLSYVLGLRGPAMTVDTACSSSLVAVHLACQSLRLQESRLAVAGGVNLMLSPGGHLVASKGRMLAPDSRCKTFDASADGYVRSEGCGMVVLKRLSDARADGDRILAVIRGTALNQDGRSSGLTAPNGRAQEEVIRQALRNGGVAPGDVTYVETHGTGTSLGDPIEVQALGTVYGAGRDPARPLLIGSVKTNIGHLEAAAGVAALIKAVLALQHGEIPPHLHFTRPNPHIPWASLPIQVVTSRQPWPDGRPQTIAVSSFGFSGTNAHLVVQAAPEERQREPYTPRPAYVLPISARSAPALSDLTSAYARVLEIASDASLPDICFTAATGRSHFEHRLAVAAATRGEMLDRLRGFLAGEQVPDVWTGEVPMRRSPEVAFVFTGQGSQYVNMGRSLYESEPVFRAALDRCSAIVLAKFGLPLLDVLYPPAGAEAAAEAQLVQTAWTQPALFALEFALSELWRSWGVVPAAVAGHSVGEYVAACVAGVFSPEDGIALVAERARLMQSLPEGGVMAAVAADERTVAAALAGHEGQAAIAAVNGPAQTVISGARGAVNTTLAKLGAAGVRSRMLAVSHAFHSPLVEPILDEFERTAGSIRHERPQMPIASNVTGRVVETDQAGTPSYWRRHALQPVRFADCLETLHELGCRVVLEIGPQPTLIGFGMQSLAGPDVTWVASLRRGHNDRAQISSAFARLYCAGAPVDWQAFEHGGGQRKTVVPTYPFQRERYWIDVPEVRRRTDVGDIVHPLLGRKLSSPVVNGVLFERTLEADSLECLSGHRIFGHVVMPAAAYLEIATAAARASGVDGVGVENLAIREPMVFDAGARAVHTVFDRSTQPAEVRIYSRPATPDEADWTLHATGRIAAAAPAAGAHLVAADVDPLERIDAARFYTRLAEGGVEYGPAFRGLADIRRSDGAASATLSTAAVRGELADYNLHPALLDACFQLLGAALPAGSGQDIYMPVEIGVYRVYRPIGASASCACELRSGQPGAETFVGDAVIRSDDGSVVAEIRSLQFKRASRQALERAIGSHAADWSYELVWRDVADASPAGKPESITWLLLADRSGAADALARTLEQRGARALAFRADDDRSAARVARVAADEARTGGVCIADFRPLDVQELDGAIAACADLARLAGSLGEARNLGAVLAIVTRGAHQAGHGGGISPAQASVAGFGRALANELSGSRIQMIDLDPREAPPSSVSQLAALLSSGARAETEVAFRGGRMVVPRLRKVRPKPLRATIVRRDGAYIVTGGLTGLGLATARFLTSAGAGHLTLLGRRAASESTLLAVEELTAAGTEISVVSADVSNLEAMRDAVARIDASGFALRGVVHAAGVIDDGPAAALDEQRIHGVMMPKAQGAVNLDALTRGRELDFFICYSAGAALFGSPGQANYAAANAYVDALMWQRKDAGVPALAINWGPWKDIGMAAALGPSQHARWAELGMTLIPPGEGLKLLDLWMRSDATQIAILPLDVAAATRLLAGRTAPPLFRDLVENDAKHAGSGGSFREQFDAASVESRQEMLLKHVRSLVGRVLGVDTVSGAYDDRNFTDLGLDSLMAVELARALQQSLVVPLSSTVAFDHATIRSLADHAASAVGSAAAATGARPDAHPAAAVNTSRPDTDAATLLANLDQLTDGDIDTLLDGLLTRTKS